MISVIVPVYKVESYLRQCLDSIVNQTYRNLEILLIDDCSPDKCGAICDEYAERDKRIRVFHLPENRGLSAARNVGLDNATGDYIGFVDSDDWIEPNMYEVFLKRIADVDIVECSKSTGGITTYNTEDSLNALLKGYIDNTVWNKLYRAKLFENIRFPVGRNFEDVAIMHVIVASASSVAVVDKQFYHYIKRTDSISQNHTAKNLIDFADAYLGRYRFFAEVQPQPEMDYSLSQAAKGISKVWRWWAGCDLEDKRRYEKRIDEYHDFSRKHFPLFGCTSWPLFLRVSALFMHSKRWLSFAVMYFLNQVYRQIRHFSRN